MEKCVDGGSNLRKKSKKIKKRNVDSPRAVPKAGERNGRDYAQEFWEPGLLQSWKARILRPPGKVPAACLLPPASCLLPQHDWQLATGHCCYRRGARITSQFFSRNGTADLSADLGPRPPSASRSHCVSAPRHRGKGTCKLQRSTFPPNHSGPRTTFPWTMARPGNHPICPVYCSDNQSCIYL